MHACMLGLAALPFAASPVQAHHGMDFITVQSWEVPGSIGSDAFGAYLFTDFEWERADSDNEYGIEPGVLFGLLPRTGLEIQSRFGKEPGGDWRYTSVTPSLLFQITPPDSSFPFRVAVSAGYEFADELDGHHHEEAEEHEHEHGEEHGEEHEHEHEEVGHHGGGHQHGVDGFEGRLILEYQAGNWLIGSNIIVDTDEDSHAVWGYSAGVRYRVCREFATGIEAQGEFESGSAHELIAGVYFEPVHQAVIKIGAGFGLTEEAPDFTLHTGLVWRF